jgi:nucleoside-diphosphate-sugar epimerase
VPYSETADTSRPLSPYAASKEAAEAICHSYHHLYGIDISILRYFTVYGPAGRPDMSIFRFVQWISEDRPVIIFGDGKQSRDFTFVDDIAKGTIAALAPAGFGIFNLGSDRPAILMDVVKLVEGLIGKTAQLQFKDAHPADVPATWADIDRARRLLGWSPAVSLEQGVAKVVEWYVQNRSWARDINTK